MRCYSDSNSYPCPYSVRILLHPCCLPSCSSSSGFAHQSPFVIIIITTYPIPFAVRPWGSFSYCMGYYSSDSFIPFHQIDSCPYLSHPSYFDFPCSFHSFIASSSFIIVATVVTALGSFPSPCHHPSSCSSCSSTSQAF